MPDLSPALRAALAVTSTLYIIKASALLAVAAPPRVALALLCGCCALQWALLDGASSLALALLASVGGPLAELPLIALGAWHYLPEASDYFPLGAGVSWAALSAITAPCYFAVTTDAIALGRFFARREAVARRDLG